MFGKMRKEGLIAVTVIIVGRILGCVILNAVELRVSNRLWMSSRNWYDAGAVCMVRSCQRDARLMAVIWYSRKDRPCNAMVEE